MITVNERSEFTAQRWVDLVRGLARLPAWLRDAFQLRGGGIEIVMPRAGGSVPGWMQMLVLASSSDKWQLTSAAVRQERTLSSGLAGILEPDLPEGGAAQLGPVDDERHVTEGRLRSHADGFDRVLYGITLPSAAMMLGMRNAASWGAGPTETPLVPPARIPAATQPGCSDTLAGGRGLVVVGTRVVDPVTIAETLVHELALHAGRLIAAQRDPRIGWLHGDFALELQEHAIAALFRAAR